MPEATSISQLERLLGKQKQRLKLLQGEKERLISRVAKIDKQLESLLGKAVAPRKVRRRKRGGKSLEQFIVDVLIQGPESKTAVEIAEAIAKAGYTSKSKNPVSLVRQICYRSKLIQTKERGKFGPASASKTPRRAPKKKKAASK